MKKSERANHITYWEQSGQTKKAYCELAGIKYPTFMSWFKNQEGVEEGGFVKLEKMEQRISLEIVFSNGIRLYSNESLSSDLLQTLQNV
ncbi:MAG: hypothetical protein GY931_03110 [Maribacter sp.]|nr:hypothetical protein [Maribacter sp.]